ncbi:AarF/ABC1/UbiB kinase family protein [Desulfurobacterium sp. TC5-1]|uniref:ABC1 kinase family protein n=1 Tax=Desulfurobacterium sp. TC5-1 TaxID=1158318 RepID=UPI0003B70CCF|nr:AarF/ABC1/UbiB kinase family protein [Desulfurobacterium sp. TC5-1]
MISIGERNRRVKDITGALFFCNYEYLKEKLPASLLWLGKLFFRRWNFLLEYSPPVRLRVALERLGPTYIKIGQMLSTRVDVFPEEYIKELEKLQDDVPPAPVDEILEVLGDIRNAFKEFSEKPIGSGSIAQVHTAVLKNGQKVAVKVIKPGVEEQIRKDVTILKLLVRKLSKFIKPLRDYRIPSIIEEFERVLLDEFDLTKEASYMEMFRKFAEEKEPRLVIPAVYWKYTNRNVLVSEFIKGTKLTDLENLEKFNRKKLAEDFVILVNRQIFELSVFHGDLHPGNIFVLDDGRLAFVDFGIIGRLSPDTFSAFFMFSYAVMKKDVDMIVEALKKVGAVGDNVNEQLLKRELLVFLDKYYNRPLSKIDAEKFFYEELAITRQFNVVLPEELLVLLKTVTHTESVARIICPDFTLPPVLQPYLKKLMPKFMVEDFRRRTMKAAASYASLIEQFPELVEKSLKSRKTERELPLIESSFILGFSIILATKPVVAPLYLLFAALYPFLKGGND